MRYAGTGMRPPCCMCNGQGWELRYVAGEGTKVVCVVCNGTKVQPRQKGEQATRNAARIDAMARSSRRR